MGKRPARPKWLRRLAIALALYAFIGFFVLPPIIKAQMRKRLAALTHRDVAIRQVRVNPFVFSLTIRGFSLKEPNGEVFSSFEEFYINFQPIASLFHWGLVFKEISLKDPYGAVIYRQDGTFNFANMFGDLPPPPPGPAKPSQPPKVLIYHLVVTNGSLAISDLTRKDPFHDELGPINLNLTNLTTVRNKNSPYSFVALTDSGERFAWSGRVSVNPPSSAGVFSLSGLKLGKYATYSHDYSRYEIAGGTLAVGADYNLDMGSGAMDLDVTNANVSLSGLVLKSPDTGETLISVPSLEVSQCDASLARHSGHVTRVKTSDGSLLVRRESDGRINLLSLLNLPAAKPGAETKPADSAPWSALIDEVAVDNYTLQVEDKVPEKPASFKVDQIALKVRDISTVSNASLTTTLSVRFQDTGFVGIAGTATLQPPSAELQIGLTNLDLRSIQPYVHEQAKLAITSCSLDLNGKARLAPERLGPPRVTFAGDVALNKLSTTDDVMFKDFTKWEALNLDGIKLELMPEKLHIDRIKVTGVSGNLVIGSDRRPLILSMLRQPIASAEAAQTNAAAGTNAATAAPAKLPEVTVDELVYTNGSVHFYDGSLEPHVSFDVAEFGGSIRGISSREGTTATVDMKGKVDERSPFSITGSMNPLAKEQFVDVTVAVTNTELTAFSPYSEKFAGHTLEKGKFSMAVHYHIENKALKAENSFYVDQLTLGPRNSSPDATKMPVKLAVALLKDRNGRIALDVPLTGRTDDPKFSVGPIIWQVIGNVLIKAATSPFALLGAAFGGGEELSYVEFAPGHAELTEAEAKKLDTLSKALFERPALSLEISGSADPATEREPLARLKFEDRVKSAFVQELTDAGKPAVTLAEVQLDPKEHERLVRKIYKQDIGKYKPTELPTNIVANSASPAPAADTDSAAPSGPARGATQLIEKQKPLVVPPRLVKAAAATGKPVKAYSRSEIEIADMEDQLVERIEITNNDFRDLMQQRAKQVESTLLKSGKVTSERLFIMAPKTIDDSFRGSNRVNLSLN